MAENLIIIQILEYGDIESIQNLLDEGINQWIIDHNYVWSSIFEGRQYNDPLIPEIVKLILDDNRIDPSSFNSYPLRMAVAYGYVSVVKMLLEDGRANPAIFDNFLLKDSIEKNNLSIIKLLLNDERVILTVGILEAALNTNIQIIKLILNNLKFDSYLIQPLLILAIKKDIDIDIFKYLISHSKIKNYDYQGFARFIYNHNYYDYNENLENKILILLKHPKFFADALNVYGLYPYTIPIISKIMNVEPYPEIKEDFKIYYERFLDAKPGSLQYLAFEKILKSI